MTNGLSNAFRNMVRKFDYDQIQYMLWQYEDALSADVWSGPDREKVINIIFYLNDILGKETSANKSLSKMPTCQN